VCARDVPDQEDRREGERGIGWCDTKRGLCLFVLDFEFDPAAH